MGPRIAGTYSYPISFLLPPGLPPTFSVPHGSLNYVIKAVAHRPGTFTAKLSCHVPLIVVAAPAIGDGEGGGDPGPLILQQQWADKLAYSLELSSRLFLLGSRRHLETAASEGIGIRANTEHLVEADLEARAEATYCTVMLDLTLLPFEKVKIWRLGVFVDQCIRYVDERGKLFRDDKKQVRLLEVEDACSAEELDPVGEEERTKRNKHKKQDDVTEIPILPTPISPHRSPLLRYISPSTDPSVLAGPGPYTLSTSIALPGCNDPSGDDHGLHFTVKQKNSGVKIEHSLRFVMRVQSVGDQGTNDHEEGDKKKQFDIAVQAPITILSVSSLSFSGCAYAILYQLSTVAEQCRCVPEYHTLPRYSRNTEDGSQSSAACACRPSVEITAEQGHGHDVENNLGHVMPSNSNSTSSFESEDGAGRSRHQTDEQHSSHERSRSSSPAHTHISGHPDPHTTPLHSHPPSLNPPSPAASRTHDPGRRTFSPHAQTHSHSHDDEHHHHHSDSPSYTVSTDAVRAHSQTPISTTARSSHPPPPPQLAQYERLVSGLESDAGDAPPSYESIASSGFQV